MRGEPDLRHHGDSEVVEGLLDLAVNVRRAAPPDWLNEKLAAALSSLGAYPKPEAARVAVAARHGRPVEHVLLTSGGAEAFVLIARAFAPRRAVCVHPSFTEPEAALLAAGHAVERVLLDWPFDLDPSVIPGDADLVVIGNPTNPTSRLHSAEALRSLARPDRLLVIDEAFADSIPGEPESLAAEQIPGLIVIRSLTKTWGLAGLRIGYVLADAKTIDVLSQAQPLWSVSSLALVAAEHCSTGLAVDEASRSACDLVELRDRLVTQLDGLRGLQVVPDPMAPFVLVKVRRGLMVRQGLIERGVVVRRCDTFPGLGPDWLRIAVPSLPDQALLLAALTDLLT